MRESSPDREASDPRWPTSGSAPAWDSGARSGREGGPAAGRGRVPGPVWDGSAAAASGATWRASTVGDPFPFAARTPALPRPTVREWIHFAVLLVFTLVSTATLPQGGLAFAFTLLGILFCHEMGHYLMARHYRVRASLPFFLPFPLSPLGTFGAVIFLRQRIRTRRVLFDIGIAGPLAGIPPTLAAVWWGLAHSRVADRAVTEGLSGAHFGMSLLLSAATHLLHPELQAGEVIRLHPVAIAGWAGLFVTSLNLIPIGQLDGGHILYGLLGPRARRVSLVLALALAVAGFWFPGWWVLLAFLLVTRLKHPSTDDEQVPLGRTRVLLGIFALLFFLLTFVPHPFDLS
ncbi:MAG: site-2 protease family protein [Candidatus Eisenbacteria bacterium]